MNRVEASFRGTGDRPVRIVYTTLGYPDLRTSVRVVRGLAAAGVDIIELGLPFSDPIADGPVIQDTSFRALQKEYSLEQQFAAVRSIRETVSVPMLFMTYVNIVHHYGYLRFVKQSVRCGMDGLVLPDLALEEAGRVSGLCGRHGLSNILFVSESTPADRLRRIASAARGFIYVVSQPGVTGKKLTVRKELRETSRRLRRITAVPLAVGFGISSREDIQKLGPYFDGIIVGSAFLKRLLKDPGKPEKAVSYIKRLFR